jgi:hypothetical protein
VVVFCLIWFPVLVFLIVGATREDEDRGVLYFQIVLLLSGIQPILSTCMAMTKSDVKKYTTNLITLSYVRTSLLSEETRAEDTNDENKPIEEQEDEIEEANSNDEKEVTIIEPTDSTIQ